MVCSSGVGFDPRIDDETYTFDVAGLYNGLFVMSDRLTGSIWTHFDGTVLAGPLAGTGVGLEIQPLIHLRWEDWLADYPDSEVLAWDERFADRYREYEPGRTGLGPEFLRTLLLTDDRLPEAELVLGVESNGATAAYVLSAVDGLTVLNDTIGETPVVVIVDPDTLFGIAYSAEVGGNVRSFSAGDGQLIDESGSVWALDGSGADGQLAFVTSFVTEWYGWVAYHPATAIVPG